ncbi:FAD-binding molybdopterin dehydrogenase [Streptomyces ruber]|uniref:FAD-binding molybdopterin dehydrogenase n=2 Tax=Streptomyces TaxID=1883 RepID=A0A918BJ15_9ACTN|nr:xanthine dehydrogenase family protein subunit M [Streptomyces ruber]GGQ72962.1 FAD-binding molybdopterin dehydrogenase [Streptomyces ruber]
MKTFRYERPDSVATAVAGVAAHPGAAFLGAGTSLVDLMKLHVEEPTLLVDVTSLSLDRIGTARDGGLVIGATVRNSDLATDPRVRAEYPLLAEAVLSGASAQIRNVATVGGNLLQRTRCPYYRDVTKPCNRRSAGSGCPALESRLPHSPHLAVLGASPACAAVHPSDLAVALTALDALIEVTGPHGTRTVPITSLYRPPGDAPPDDTVLARADMITAVRLPAATAAWPCAYRKARDRASFAFGTASVAAALRMTGDHIVDVKLAFGAVAPVPWRARHAERALTGRRPVGHVLRQAVDAELVHARPLHGNAFKVDLLRNMTVSLLSELAGRAA